LLRGTEWVATGRVTQKVPADFPTNPDVLSYRLDLAKMDSTATNQPRAGGAPVAPGAAPARATLPAPVTGQVGCAPLARWNAADL